MNAPGCPVVELRQYTLHVDQRDLLIEHFERHFVASQNALGAHVLGQCRDLDDPDRFVWWRGFTDRDARLRALTRFYEEPVWQTHRGPAVATMLDTDNVLLLRARRWAPRPPTARRSTLVVGLHTIAPVVCASFERFFEATLEPALGACGAPVFATLAPETTPNAYTRLPVRENEFVFAWCARLDEAQTRAGFEAEWRARRGWREHVPEALWPALMRKPEWLWLAPTETSALR
jgi:hypothetical protein